MDNIKIGKVNIDLKHYSGNDLYSEGEIEDKLLKVAEEKEPKDFRKIIEDSESWSYLYHLSKERENIVSWLPISKSDKVLDVGAGPGAIAGELCKLALSVDCIDLSTQNTLQRFLRPSTRRSFLFSHFFSKRPPKKNFSTKIKQIMHVYILQVTNKFRKYFFVVLVYNRIIFI